VLADGFYEWKSLPEGKQPYRFTLTDHGVFAFAGVWSEGDVPTYVILTTRANGLTVQVHHRMPVMLARSAWPAWLGRDPDPEEAFRFLGPYPEERMEGYPVGRAVNHSGNQGPELIEAVDSSGRPGRDRR
jgi:putative SOS response-associated peptidase YedK